MGRILKLLEIISERPVIIVEKIFGGYLLSKFELELDQYNLDFVHFRLNNRPYQLDHATRIPELQLFPFH